MNNAPKQIPAEFNEIFERIHLETLLLHGRWLTYRALFAESQERINMLNSTASGFFRVIENALFDGVELGLSRLTDPARNKSQENLSLLQLQEKLETYGEPALALRCQNTLNALLAQCKPFRDRRHKLIAHFDLDVAMKNLVQPLPGVSRQMVDDALRSIRSYLNDIHQHYSCSEWAYQHLGQPNGANALLATIRAGQRYEELVQARELSLDDWKKGKWGTA